MTDEIDSKGPDMSWLWPILKQNGWPTGMLLLVFFCGWRFVDWAKPIAETVAKAHLGFVDKTADAIAKQAENGQKLAEQTARLTTIAEKQDKRIEDIHRAVVKKGTEQE